MSELPYMPEHVHDLMAETASLTNEELGAFMRLRWQLWRAGGYIAGGQKMVARLTQSDDRWKLLARNVLQKITIAGGKISSPTLLETLALTRARRRKFAERGTGGAEAKWKQIASGETRSQRLTAARARATHTELEWHLLVHFCDHRCVRCEAEKKVVKDHIIPLYQGGSDGIENLQPLCAPCNASKGAESKDWRPVGWQDACKMPAKTPTERPAIKTRIYSESKSLSKSDSAARSRRVEIATEAAAYEKWVVFLMNRTDMRAIAARAQLYRWLGSSEAPELFALLDAVEAENLRGPQMVNVIDQRVQTAKRERERGSTLPFPPNAVKSAK